MSKEKRGLLYLIAFFLAFSLLPGLYDLYVYRTWRAQAALDERGVETIATVVDVGRTTGAMAVGSAALTFEFEVDEGGAPRRIRKRVVLTGGLSHPAVGDAITIVYQPDAPDNAQVVGNPGNFASLLVPLIPLNLLWLVLFGVVVMAVIKWFS